MLVLSDAHVRTHAKVWRTLSVNKQAFIDLEKGRADVPSRIVMEFNGIQGASLFKPCK